MHSTTTKETVMSAIDHATARVAAPPEPAARRRLPTVARAALAFVTMQVPLILIALAFEWRENGQDGALLDDYLKEGSSVSGPLSAQLILLTLAFGVSRGGRIGRVAAGGIGVMGVLIVINGVMAGFSDTDHTPRAACVAAAVLFVSFGATLVLLGARHAFSRQTSTIAALVVTSAVALAAAGPAAADSIVFTKAHDVWIAEPDGSNLHQVTKDGTDSSPYRSPSQADDGTIVASHGQDIVRLRQNGHVLSRFDPPPGTDSTGGTVDGVPLDVAVSPDGSRISFVYHNASCPIGAPCGARQVLLYSHADRATPVSEFGQHTNRRNPSWIDGNRVLMFGGAGAHVNVDSPGGGNDDHQHWYDDAGMEDLDDGELSRAGDRLAIVRSYGSNTHIGIYAVSGIGGAAPAEACFTGTDASLSGPSWSPDGRSLAFAHSQGIEVLPLPNVVPGDCPGAGSGVVKIPGGAEPDWGPAGVNPGSDDPPPCQPAATCEQKQKLGLRIAKKGKLRAALRKGVLIKVAVPGAGKVTAAGKAGRRKVASGRTTAGAAGTAKVRLKFTRKAARKLRRKRSLRLAVAVKFTPSAGGAPMGARGSIRLGR
jgi:WD40 repeat protein